MATDNQMFLDHGPESFVAEIIGLVKLRRLHIDVMPAGTTWSGRLRRKRRPA
jgi:hypothetical protein